MTPAAPMTPMAATPVAATPMTTPVATEMAAPVAATPMAAEMTAAVTPRRSAGRSEGGAAEGRERRQRHDGFAREHVELPFAWLASNVSRHAGLVRASARPVHRSAHEKPAIDVLVTAVTSPRQSRW